MRSVKACLGFRTPQLETAIQQPDRSPAPCLSFLFCHTDLRCTTDVKKQACLLIVSLYILGYKDFPTSAGGFAYVCLHLWMVRASEWVSVHENACSGTFRSESRTWGVSPYLLYPSALRWGSSLVQKTNCFVKAVWAANSWDPPISDPPVLRLRVCTVLFGFLLVVW